MSSDIIYKGATFYKCALQVNPHSYAEYRGTPHACDEETYNRKIVEQCQSNNITVVGLADHGSVESSASLRECLTKADITVFPGFEICTSEDVHLVCLFSASCTKEDLIGYIARLGIDTNNPTKASELSAHKILAQVKDMGGIIFAAHCTHKNGVLLERFPEIWKNPLLQIAQIPGTIDDLAHIDGGFYHRVLLNKEDNYRRDHPMAIIHAKDIAVPEDLAHPAASCYIKMTRASFHSFKHAFFDPDLRIHLHHHMSAASHAWIRSIEWSDIECLAESQIALSKNLNAIIGGRGTGKSTLIEGIRYVLDSDIHPQSIDTVRKHRQDTMSNSCITLTVVSKAQHGNVYTISRRYGKSPVVKNEKGEVSHLTPKDILPGIEILGQNEILAIEQDPIAQLKLLNTFIPNTHTYETNISELKRALAQNRTALLRAVEEYDQLEQEVNKAPQLQEQAAHFKQLGITDKLAAVELLEKEGSIHMQIQEQFDSIQQWSNSYAGIFKLTFLQDNSIALLPNRDIITDVHTIFEELQKNIDSAHGQISNAIQSASKRYGVLVSEWAVHSGEINAQLRDASSKLPEHGGKSGTQLAAEYQEIIAQLAQIDKKKTPYEQQKCIINKHTATRKQLLTEYHKIARERYNATNTIIQELNRAGLQSKVNISITRRGNTDALWDFLHATLDGIGDARLGWLEHIDGKDINLTQWATWIAEGNQEAFMAAYRAAGITAGTVDRLLRMELQKRLELQEVEILDIISIELNTAHKDAKPHYVPLDNLSIGQKCTAILNILLLNRHAPLVIDQPEDNLDNAFIAERIVEDIRRLKGNTQFIFATHNANIPIFGDAELIAVLGVDAESTTGAVQCVGSIDDEEISRQAAEILEGGKAAFNMRKVKYGF